jgi:peptidyl-prolyl isomerase H (cyclophilin H)
MAATQPSITRPIVFIDINIGESSAGRIKMELFSDITPMYALSARLAPFS